LSALYVVLAIIALSVLMIFHEYGHYLAAKRLHYPVTAFGIGFGPNIIKKQIGETEFRVGILLFGAYVEVPAMDGEGNETIKPLHKVAIALAGPLMNFILAFLVVFVVLVSGNPWSQAQLWALLFLTLQLLKCYRLVTRFFKWMVSLLIALRIFSV